MERDPAVPLPGGEVIVPPPANIVFPPKFRGLFVPKRYKVMYGGRGSSKSWSVARALILLTMTTQKRESMRIGCFRELQSSISDSVHRLLADQIAAMGFSDFFKINQTSIQCRLNGASFLFKGLRHNITEVKSTEGIDIAWVEEAQHVTSESWETLIPTIRAKKSEIWVTFNPYEEKDATYQRFVVNTPPNAWVEEINWYDNPWFPEELNAERLYMQSLDPEAYAHIWEGKPKTQSDAIIFRNRYVVEAFETHPDARFLHGVDWGFAVDPLALVRAYVTKESDGEHLWIDQEAYGHGVELDEHAQFFARIDTARDWPIKADNSRPETISFMCGRGFNVKPAAKWAGSVEDGIAHIKGFRKIHIHSRCKHTAEEFRLYSYKVDRNTGDVLPVIVDRHNHCVDAIRYALDGYIQTRGGLGVWETLGRK